jgi:alpha/beta superfamily hydrolase
MTPTTKTKAEAGISKIVFYLLPVMLAVIGYFLNSTMNKIDRVYEKSIKLEEQMISNDADNNNHWMFCRETKDQVNDHEKRIIWMESKQRRPERRSSESSSNNGAQK